MGGGGVGWQGGGVGAEQVYMNFLGACEKAPKTSIWLLFMIVALLPKRHDNEDNANNALASSNS